MIHSTRMDYALQIMHYPLWAATYFHPELLRIYVQVSNVKLSLSTPSNDYHPFDLNI